MILPETAVFDRVDELAAQMEGLSTIEARRRLEELRAAGEPESVLSLLGSWRDLPPLPTSFDTGDVVAERYRLGEKLGEGGMGCVWRATQLYIARDVAVKMIHPALVSPAFAERFVKEMEMLGRLAHPGIVKIHDAGMARDPAGREMPFYAMEHVDGITVTAWAAERRNDLPALLRMLAAVCAAVHHAHERRIVHRDLKPANILVRKDGQPVVLDFGVARLEGAVEEDGARFAGTPQYAAPEQHLGCDRDFRSGESVDIYALGAIAFEALTGRRLFLFPRHATISEMRNIIVDGVPPRLSEMLAVAPPLVEEVIARAVRRDPADRYYSISALGRALLRAAESCEDPGRPPIPRWRPERGAVVPGGNWTLTYKLGEGSAGEVWAAEHPEFAERRVIKFCDSDAKARTLRREMTLYRLLKERVGRNPHFVQLHEVALEEEPWYLMMEHSGARDLEAWVAALPGELIGMSVETRVEIVAQAAEALQSAHEAGILHRDMKPANLLVRNVPGGGLHVLLSDFGIGQIVADELLRHGTRGGFTQTVSELRRSTLSGTMLYMAPEVLGGAEATARSDIYSLGVVLWQLLAGGLQLALDPTDWSARIEDPLLREDLRKCLAGAPEKRWASAGELAASLRALPNRRLAEARHAAEFAERERAAYRRGVLRTAGIASVIGIFIVGLAIVALAQRSAARRAKAQSSLEQADKVFRFESQAGRRKMGLALLQEAAAYPENLSTIRGLAAGFLAMPDLVSEQAPAASAIQNSGPNGNSAYAFDHQRKLLAAGNPADDVQGVVDLVEQPGGKVRPRIERPNFPWVPIPEAGLLQFSPDDGLLAIAGPETSRHVLLCDPRDGLLRAYIFPADGLKCIAWHSGGRLLATGGNNRAVQIWDVASGRVPQETGARARDFELPPKLSEPAIDVPLTTLQGWRDAVGSMTFSSDGAYLGALDSAGWLRIWSGFAGEGLPGLLPASQAGQASEAQLVAKPKLLLETKLEGIAPGCVLSYEADRWVIRDAGGKAAAYAIDAGACFCEKWVGPGLHSLAWSGDSQTLCAISDTDIYWLRREPLSIMAQTLGRNAVAVAYDETKNCWALPTGKSFEVWRLTGDGAAKPAARLLGKLDLSAAQNARAGRVGLADRGGLFAVYYGKKLQFIDGGGRQYEERAAITSDAGGVFKELLWDRQGSMATVVTSTAQGLGAESYLTREASTVQAASISIPAQRLICAEESGDLIARGVAAGIVRVNARTGASRPIDQSKEAKQDAPLALSPDGRWLAAVIDRDSIRLIEAQSGQIFADIPTRQSTDLRYLAWAPSGQFLSAITTDGSIQVWSFAPWFEWLRQHHLWTHPK